MQTKPGPSFGVEFIYRKIIVQDKYPRSYKQYESVLGLSEGSYKIVIYFSMFSKL